MQQSTSFAAFFAIAFMLCSGTFAENAIYGWGANDYGQLGLGVLENPVRQPVQVGFYSNLASVNDIQLAASYHIASLSDGSAYVSGNNFYGCLGLNLTNPTGNNSYTPTPQLNPSLQDCTVVASKRHANAICGGKAFGWGLWSGNVIGATTGVWPKVHQSNNGPASVSSINVVQDGTFVTSAAGIFAAGNGTNGKLGLGDALSRGKLSQTPFFGSDAISMIFSSQSDHICAAATNDSLYCWGNNDQGQVGSGSAGGFISSPQVVPGIEDGQYIISQVVYGQEHTVALSCGGAVLTWGSRQFGVIGDGVSSNQSQPSVTVVPTLADKNIVEIASASNSVFARGADGTWYTWGAGFGGVLATQSDFNVLTPQSNDLLKNLGINHIATGGSSRSAFGWNVPNVFTTTQNCPTLTNECNSANNCATSNSVCIDTDRFYKCACAPGFQGDGYQPPQGVGCSDVDECADGSAQCDPHSTCVNTVGSYECTCADDYHGNGYWTNATSDNIALPGQGCILNVDECDNETLNNCSPFATCTDTIWAYNCSCQPGFLGNGVSCKDINECAATQSPCGSNSVCSNTNGSFSCACIEGFGSSAGTGANCADIDECLSNNTCDVNADCTNTVGSYVCTCNTGYKGNGSVCESINGTAAPSTPSPTSSPINDTSNGTTVGDAQTTGSGSSESTTGGTGFPTSGSQGNTLDVNTIGNSDTIAPGSTSTSTSSQSTGGDFIVNTNTASDNSEEKKILVGVFVGFIGLVIVAVAVVIVVVIRRRKRQNAWM